MPLLLESRVVGLIVLLFSGLSFAEGEIEENSFKEYFGIYFEKLNDTIPNQDALYFACPLQAIYLITNSAVPDQEKYAKILEELKVKDEEVLKELEKHSKQKIREWFDIHENSFNEGGYLKYNHPMTYQINYNEDTASKLTGEYLYDYLSEPKKKLAVFKSKSKGSFETSNDILDDPKAKEEFSKVAKGVKSRSKDKTIKKSTVKNYWNLCRISTASHNKLPDICNVFTEDDAQTLAKLECTTFYNMDYSKSKLIAEPILTKMSSKLIDGIGSAVTYINFVHPYQFMAVFDVLNSGLIKYYKLPDLTMSDSKTAEHFTFTTGEYSPLLSTFTILKRKCPSSKNFDYDVYLNGNLWRDAVTEDNFKQWIFEKGLKNDGSNVRFD